MRYRILFVLCSEEFGGVENSVLMQLKTIDLSRFEPVILSPKIPKLIENIKLLGFEWRELQITNSLRDLNRTSFLGRFYKALDAVKVLPKIFNVIRRLNPDVVYASGSRALKLSLLPSKILRVPIVWTGHNIFESTLIDRILPYIADGSTFVSVGVRRVNLPDEKTSWRWKIIPNSVDLGQDYGGDGAKIRNEFGIGVNDFLVGLVSRISPGKGHNLLVEAAGQVIEIYPAVKFMFVGGADVYNPQYQEELQKMISKAGLSSHFIWAGFRSDIPDIMNALDVFVLPSESEGLPIVLIEAGAAWKPVIASHLPGATDEVVLQNQTGILIDKPLSSKEFAKAILKLIENPELRISMGMCARERVMSLYDIKKNIRAYEDFLEEVIHKS